MPAIDSNSSILRQSVTESDIDWLLCVELNASGEFRDWWAERLFKGFGRVSHIGAWRSVSTNEGESDLLWLVETAKGTVLGMVENKINADAQPNQYDRYVSRGNDYVRDSTCQQFRIALFSPRAYRSEDSELYPIRIYYEDVCEWLGRKEDERSQFLANIYRSRIEKRNEHVLAPEDADAKLFHQKIWELADSCFPDLAVPHPDLSNKSASQTWLYIRHPGFMIIYKMFKKRGKYGECVVDLQLAGRGADVNQLQERYKSHMAGSRICVVKTEKSASFRIPVPPITPPHFDESAVREALQAASTLKSWWESSRQDEDR